MDAVRYHDTVKDLQASRYWRDYRDAICLPLQRGPRGLEALTNWYAFTWEANATHIASEGPVEALARDLARRAVRIELTKVPDERGAADMLEDMFRRGGWFVVRERCDSNHFLEVRGRSFAGYLADRPGPLRTTLKRKAKKVEVTLSTASDPADWAAYEAIYCRQLETRGRGSRPAAPLRDERKRRRPLPLRDRSPRGQTGRRAILDSRWRDRLHLQAGPPRKRQAAFPRDHTDRGAVRAGDRRRCRRVCRFRYRRRFLQADWMEQVRVRWRLTCLRPERPRNCAPIGKTLLRKLVSRPHAG